MPQNDANSAVNGSPISLVPETSEAAYSIRIALGSPDETCPVAEPRSFPMSSSLKLAIPDPFPVQKWHQPYADALIEDDPARVPARIASAAAAILARQMELLHLPVQTDENVDLLNAERALAQLKKYSCLPR